MWTQWKMKILKGSLFVASVAAIILICKPKTSRPMHDDISPVEFQEWGAVDNPELVYGTSLVEYTNVISLPTATPTPTPVVVVHKSTPTPTPVTTVTGDAIALKDLPDDDYTCNLSLTYYSQFAIDCNTRLYDLCYTYYRVPCEGDFLPILVPMAIANNETPGRANFDITLSALFPSALVSLNSVDEIETFSILDVVSDKALFKKINTEWSGRDRGALQMNPMYGSAETVYYDLMGKSESELLKGIEAKEGWYAYETKAGGGAYSMANWLSRASLCKGDRFNVKDVILRMANASNSAVHAWKRNYTVTNEYQQVIMLAMYHANSGVWSMSNPDKKIGKWHSMNVAYEYASDLASEEFVSLVFRRAFSDIETARRNGRTPRPYIGESTRQELFAQAERDGILSDVYHYVSDTFVIPWYPIGALYNYIMLKLLYMGY